MLPIFNPNSFHSSQLQPNGTSSSTPQQQVMGTNPGNFGPNPMQMGGIFNRQFNQFAPLPFQGPNNLNPVAMNNNFANFNACQQMGQILPQSTLNPAQFLNQNVNLGVPNGQWNLHNPMQNMNMNTNPFFQMGIPNIGQVLQGVSPQNLAFLANAHLGYANSGVGNQMPNAGLQLQGNLVSTQAFGSVQPLQNQKLFNQGLSQGNPGKATDDNQMRGNWKKPQNNNYIGNRKHDASHSGSMKSHFHHKQNAKGNFRAHKEQRGKGDQDVTARKPALCNSSGQNQGQKKRPLLLSYTDQEVRQWREERRKHYPSKANMEKKLTEKVTESATSDRAAKLRRQQLKEVLAKQAELGCEVAEIPSSYLSDSEQQVHGREGKRPFSKKERFQNKFNKRGKFHQNDRFSKRLCSGNPDSSNIYEQNDQSTKKQFIRNNEPTSRGALSNREPTLLQKLLSADIRRDQRRLLQVFRFMVMNSFFKDRPEKALKFPTTLVKQSGNEGEIVEEKGVTESIYKTGIDESIHKDVSNTNYDDNDEAVLANHDQERVGGIRKQGPQEEEGEIID